MMEVRPKPTKHLVRIFPPSMTSRVVPQPTREKRKTTPSPFKIQNILVPIILIVSIVL